MIHLIDEKPFKEMAFPESSKANPRVLVNLLAEHFAATITGTHREQVFRLKDPASLTLVLRRTGVAFYVQRNAEAETDEVIDTIDQIEVVLKRALGIEIAEEEPEENHAPPDDSLEIGKAIVSALMAQNLVTFASSRSQPQLEKQLANALRQRSESVEEIAECIMECSGVAELHANDHDLAAILRACMPGHRR